MKNSALAMSIVLLLSCSTPEAKSSKAIEQSLKAVVVGETNAYMDKDYPKWSSYWDHSEDVLRLDISEAGFAQTKGWYKSGGNLELFFEENPERITSTFKNSNYLIFHDSNLAWVAFDQTWKSQARIKVWEKRLSHY